MRLRVERWAAGIMGNPVDQELTVMSSAGGRQDFQHRRQRGWARGVPAGWGGRGPWTRSSHAHRPRKPRRSLLGSELHEFYRAQQVGQQFLVANAVLEKLEQGR